MDLATRIKILIQPHKIAAKFIILFILYFVLAQGIYMLVESHIKPVYMGILHTRVPCKIINILTPSHEATTQDDKIISSRGPVIIGKGCDATSAILLVAAALGAFSMPFLRKIVGFLLALAVLYLANLVRIVSMFYVYLIRPELFHFMHFYIGQIFIIAIGWLFFLYWIRACRVRV
jgi:exosortase family protein XrtM